VEKKLRRLEITAEERKYELERQRSTMILVAPYKNLDPLKGKDGPPVEKMNYAAMVQTAIPPPAIKKSTHPSRLRQPVMARHRHQQSLRCCPRALHHLTVISLPPPCLKGDPSGGIRHRMH
nr:hypothetical protein [Akkermansiaceae bacterium]